MVSLACYPCFCKEKDAVELFTSQSEVKYIRCKTRECGFFTSAESFTEYMTLFMEGVLKEYKDDGAYCSHKEAATLCMSKSEKNPGRGFFKCGTLGEKCRYFQWADEPASKVTKENRVRMVEKEVQTDPIVEDSNKKRKMDVKKPAEKKDKKRKVLPLDIE